MCRHFACPSVVDSGIGLTLGLSRIYLTKNKAENVRIGAKRQPEGVFTVNPLVDPLSALSAVGESVFPELFMCSLTLEWQRNG